MKHVAIACLLAAGVAGVQAETYIDNARVRSVDPQYENVAVPRNECTNHWINEPRHHGRSNHYGGAVIGGVAGGLLGHQIGRGDGREAATALGAVIGAFAGDHIGNRDRWNQYEEVPREVRRCRTVTDVQARITGYRVNYEYRGQFYSTLMRENPGSSLQVRVSFEPIERY